MCFSILTTANLSHHFKHIVSSGMLKETYEVSAIVMPILQTGDLLICKMDITELLPKISSIVRKRAKIQRLNVYWIQN